MKKMKKEICMTCGSDIGVDVCVGCMVKLCVLCMFGLVEEEHFDNCKFS